VFQYSKNKQRPHHFINDTASFSVLQPVLNSHAFLNDLSELASMQEFLNSTSLERDFKRKHQRKYTDQENKKRPLSVIWQEAGLKFHDSARQ